MNGPAVQVHAEDLTLECVVSSGRICHLEASFSYDSTDPYAVTIEFSTGNTRIPWQFARDLLDRGLTMPYGDGDVHMWPSLDYQGHAVLVIELSSDTGEFRAQARSRDVMRFLQRSYEIVPAGDESEHVDLDSLVDELLAG